MASGKKGKARRKHEGGITAGVRGMPDRTRRPKSVEDLFGGGYSGNLLHPDFDRADVYAWFQRRHLKGHTLISKDGYYRSGDHEWRVPYGVRIAMKTPLIHNQIVVRYPFYATWVSPKTGKRHKKFCTSIIAAVIFIATKAQYVDSDASIVARVVGYDVPAKLRGKLPRKMNGRQVYWCPSCMDARRFRRVEPAQEFYALKKVWSAEKGRFIPTERKLAVLACTVCGITNRDHKFRRSNQPFELRKIKKGVRRVRKVKRRKK